MENNITRHSLSPEVARKLANTTKTIPMMEELTPQWLLKFLPWVPVEAGSYRVNKKKKPEHDYSHILAQHMGEHDIPETFRDYEEAPVDYVLDTVRTILRVNTHVADIFNNPINQFDEQMRLTVEGMKEHQEWEILNNKDFGLLNSVHEKMKLKPRRGSPTPDDMDELLSRVWKKPAFFLAHPRAIAAFGRECTRRGVPPATVSLYGSPFLTWRGVPIVPTNKLLVNKDTNTTEILLLRVGEAQQGVVGLHQPGVPDEQFMPSLSVKFAGINAKGIASYILNLYFSAAVLTKDAIGMLENVEVGNFYDYQ